MKTLNLKLRIWRQNGPDATGRFEDYAADGISEEASFLEMLDIVNERLIEEGEEPVTFDHDCREGICGMCSLVINGIPHGPDRGATVCQLHMRMFKDGDEIWIEPWRAKAFPVIRDLVVDRTSFDRIVSAGGYISQMCGSAPDANAIPRHSGNATKKTTTPPFKSAPMVPAVNGRRSDVLLSVSVMRVT